MINVTKEKYTLPSGATLTMRFNNGVLHDSELPSITLTTLDGLSLHMHFRDGKLDSIHPQTLEVMEENGVGLAIQFREGRYIQAGKPGLR